MDAILNVRPKDPELQGHIAEIFHDIGIGKDFLAIIQKIQTESPTKISRITSRLKDKYTLFSPGHNLESKNAAKGENSILSI